MPYDKLGNSLPSLYFEILCTGHVVIMSHF
jgi:hypothetical protein